MRLAPASHLRGIFAKPVQAAPREGTKLRALYDLFQANKGKPLAFVVAGSKASIESLVDYYGLDIRCIRRGEWVLAGEWFGHFYHDYLSEHLKSLEAA